MFLESEIMADFNEFREHTRRLFVKPDSTVEKMVHAVMGVSGEAGELVDAIKKHWIYGKELDSENVLEECGDLLFYMDRILDLCGYTIEDAMQANFEKLRIRYPQGYTDYAARDRADKAASV